MTISMGEPGPPEWHLVRESIPSSLRPPLHLMSVQLHEPGFGAVHTPGEMLFDDIHVLTGPAGEEQSLEGFEGDLRWSPILTSALSSDRVVPVEDDPRSGNRAVLFSFGRENVLGVRGFYFNPTAGPVPVVLSASLAKASGIRIGQVFKASIAERGVRWSAET